MRKKVRWNLCVKSRRGTSDEKRNVIYDYREMIRTNYLDVLIDKFIISKWELIYYHVLP